MRFVVTISAVAMMLLCLVPVGYESEGASEFTVEDGLDREFRFSGPVNHIITIGVGPTATAIGVGALDKIVVSDNYSARNEDPLFKEFKERVNSGKIAAGGNIYSSGKDQLKTDIIMAADEKTGSFDKNRDAVIVVGSDTYRKNIVPDLGDFRYVLQWNDITDYGDIVDFAEAISMICTGRVVSEVRAMAELEDYIDDKVEKARVAQAKAFYVTFSSGVFKVSNYGSLAASMIEAAEGKVVTLDRSKTGTTYEANITDVVASNPGCVIFVDNTIHSNADNMDKLRKAVDGKAELINLKPIWNNYCIESMDGVWAMACALYPTLFEGDVPFDKGGSDDMTMIYIGAGVAAVGIIAVGSFFFLRKGI